MVKFWHLKNTIQKGGPKKTAVTLLQKWHINGKMVINGKLISSSENCAETKS